MLPDLKPAGPPIPLPEPDDGFAFDDRHDPLRLPAQSMGPSWSGVSATTGRSPGSPPRAIGTSVCSPSAPTARYLASTRWRRHLGLGRRPEVRSPGPSRRLATIRGQIQPRQPSDCRRPSRRHDPGLRPGDRAVSHAGAGRRKSRGPGVPARRGGDRRLLQGKSGHLPHPRCGDGPATPHHSPRRRRSDRVEPRRLDPGDLRSRPDRIILFSAARVRAGGDAGDAHPMPAACGSPSTRPGRCWPTTAGRSPATLGSGLGPRAAQPAGHRTCPHSARTGGSSSGRDRNSSPWQVDPAVEYTTLAYASDRRLNHATARRFTATAGSWPWAPTAGSSSGTWHAGRSWASCRSGWPGTSLFEPSGDLLTNGAAGVLRWPVRNDPSGRRGPDRAASESAAARGRTAGSRPTGPARSSPWPAYGDARVALGDRTIRSGRWMTAGTSRSAPTGSGWRPTTTAVGGVTIWSLPDGTRVTKLLIEGRRLVGIQPRREMAGDRRPSCASSDLGSRELARGPRDRG